MFDAISSQASKLVNLTNGIKKNYSKTKLVTITSGKGGVGKSTFTANMAFLLSRRGYKVAVLDADIGLANMQILFDMKPQSTFFEYIDGVKTTRCNNRNKISKSLFNCWKKWISICNK